MPGLSASKWASRPTDDAPPAQMVAENEKQTAAERHVSVPSFGFSMTNTTARSQPLQAPSKPSTMPHSVSKPQIRADAAGKAAAKRMDELQDGLFACRRPSPASTGFNKRIFYQDHDRTNSPQGLSPATSDTPPFRGAHSTAKATEAEQQRIYKLFRQWVPRAEEFYATCGSLGLSDNDIAAIRKEIVEYRVQTTIAAGKRATYTTPWETPRSYLAHSMYAPKPAESETQQVEVSKTTNATVVDSSDPFGLGLASSPACKGQGLSSEVVNLMD
ncbi:hypothetical protein EJ07DRAFT_171708 [Lizonia empirigonia]|nr:hypothetical protein EJ07DRAFT_171708 [Lizonia empirigonia]